METLEEVEQEIKLLQAKLLLPGNSDREEDNLITQIRDLQKLKRELLSKQGKA